MSPHGCDGGMVPRRAVNPQRSRRLCSIHSAPTDPLPDDEPIPAPLPPKWTPGVPLPPMPGWSVPPEPERR